MGASEITAVLKHVENAFAVLDHYPGKLTASEISMKSMLAVMRSQIRDQIVREEITASSDGGLLAQARPLAFEK